MRARGLNVAGLMTLLASMAPLGQVRAQLGDKKVITRAVAKEIAAAAEAEAARNKMPPRRRCGSKRFWQSTRRGSRRARCLAAEALQRASIIVRAPHDRRFVPTL
jgi:hypothetical protein